METIHQFIGYAAMNPASSDIDMMNQNWGCSGSVEPSTCGIQNLDTSSIPDMRQFMDRNSGRNVILRDFT